MGAADFLSFCHLPRDFGIWLKSFWSPPKPPHMLGRVRVLGDVTSSAPKLWGVLVPGSNHAHTPPPPPWSPLFCPKPCPRGGWLCYDTARPVLTVVSGPCLPTLLGRHPCLAQDRPHTSTARDPEWDPGPSIPRPPASSHLPGPRPTHIPQTLTCSCKFPVPTATLSSQKETGCEASGRGPSLAASSRDSNCHSFPKCSQSCTFSSGLFPSRTGAPESGPVNTSC